MRQDAPNATRGLALQFLLGFVGGFLPLLIEAGDLADPFPAVLSTSIEAAGCLAYCAALLTAVSCLVNQRGRIAALGLLTGLVLTTALAVLWAVLAFFLAR